MTNHPNRSQTAGLTPEQHPIKVIEHTANSVEFECAGSRYVFYLSDGRIYLNVAGEIVCQADMGSFCFSSAATGGQVAAHAKLFGASIRRIKED